MKRLLSILCVTTAAFAMFSCTKEDTKPIPLEFNVLKNGNTILDNKTVIELNFDESTTFDLTMSGVASIETEKPAGWDCAVIKSEKIVNLKAPSSSDSEAEREGAIIFKVYDADGKLFEHSFDVKATEAAMSFELTDINLEETLLFRQGGTQTIPFSASKNVVSIKCGITDGWTATADLDSKMVTITAPAEEGMNEEGEFVLVPVSAFGTEGEAVTLKVKISRDIPVMTFAKTTYGVNAGSSMEIPFEGSYVSNVSFENVPEGWNFEADVKAGKIVVTAPASGASRAEVTVNYESPVGLAGEANTICCKFFGINCVEDLHALRSAIDNAVEEKNSDIDAYLVNGEVRLNTDLTITDADLIHVDGSTAEKSLADQRKAVVSKFCNYTFNGGGHTVTFDINPDYCRFGFFYTFGALYSDGVKAGITVDDKTLLKDINFAGTIKISYTTTGKSQGMAIAPVVVYNKGGKMQNVNSSVELSSTRDDLESLANNDLIKQGEIGGITSIDQFGRCEYKNCTFSGKITIDGGIQNIGGIVGYADNYDGKMLQSVITGCKNTADFSIHQKAGMHSDAYIGGILGSSRTSQPIITDCENKGNFNIDLENGFGSVQSCGGIIGSGYGTLVRCKNYGNITVYECAKNASGNTVNRRYGGIIGGPGTISTSKHGENVFRHNLENCENHGNIKGASSMMGGIVGRSEKNTGEKAIFKGCVNYGTVESTEQVMTMGGIAAVCNGGDFYNCINRGTIKGAIERDAAGIIGSIDWSDDRHDWTIDGCENYGNFELTGENKSGAVVAGIAVHAKNAKARYSVTNCKASFSVTGSNLTKEPAIGKYGNAIISAFTIDEATKNNCKIN